MAATLLHIESDGVKIPVIFEKDERLPLIVVELVFKNSGSAANKKAGLASLSASLLGEGTKKEGAVKFAKELDDHAVNLHAGVGRETFAIDLEALDSEFGFALQKLGELLRDPNFTDEAFEKVKRQRLGQLMAKKSDYDYIAAVNLRKMLFPESPMGEPQLGDGKSISSLTLDDLKEFISSHLFKNNLIIQIGGKMNEEEAMDIAKKISSYLKKGEVKEIPHYRASDKNETVTTYEDTEQAYIYFGSPYNMSVDSPKQVLGKIAIFALGSSGFGSRLMEEIRVKRGLAYSVYTRFAVNRTTSYMSGYLQTKLESQDEAKKEVKKIIDDFVKNGITQEELESAKKFYLGSEPLRTETMAQRLNRAFHEYYSGLGLGWSKKELQMIQDATLEEVNEFIKSHQEIDSLSWSIVTKKSK